jgi:hypothetical protein
MFGRLAPKLHDNGWAALIPLVPGEKRPAFSGWEAYNINPPTDLQIARWAETHPHHGIGLAYGPDEVVGSDLDFLDPDKAAAARAINDEHLGPSPMIRIGRPPKVMCFYRAAPGLQVPGKNFGGFELFRSSGQTVLYGIHPDTGRPYDWPEESPESLSPFDLPIITQRMLDAYIAAMEPLREDRVVTCSGATVTNTSATTEWLRQFSQMRTPAEMIDAACNGIKGVGVGARHATMLATTMALTTRGVTPAEFLVPIQAAYTSTLNEKEAQIRRNAVRDAARWANAKAWSGAVAVPPVKLRVRW